MSYASEAGKIVRTRQDLVVVGVRECQNHYATLIQQLLTRTEEFDHADWTKTSVTVTPDNAAAPDGTQTADTVSFDATNDAIFQAAPLAVTSKAFTGSVWMRIASGSKTINLVLRNAGNTERAERQITVTTTWMRSWVSKKFSATPVDNVVLELVRDAAVDMTDLQVWGANLYRNPSDLDLEIYFPYTRRSAEAASAVAVNVSRCSVSDQGDGNRCFYSRPTCQDVDNFNAGRSYEATATKDTTYQPWEYGRLGGIREFRFCRKDALLAQTTREGNPDPRQVMPLLVSVPRAAQEIDAERAVTINERVTFEFDDDASPPLWNPRQKGEGALVNTQRGVGTFWRRWAAIYRNYGNPEGYVILKSGFVETGAGALNIETDTEGSPFDSVRAFRPRGRYLIRNWESSDRRIKLVCSDRLKLTRRKIPSKVSDDNLALGPLTDVQTTIQVTDASEISPPAANAASASPDYIVVVELEPDTASSEKVNVTAIDLGTNTLTVQRGRWGTTAKTHNKSRPFREVAEFGTERTTPSQVPLGKNPVDIVLELYRYAGLAASEIDTAALTASRDVWLYSTLNATTGEIYGPLFRWTVTDVTDVESLVREIRELTMLLLWVDESQKLTGRLFAPLLPTETYTELSDAANLIAGTVEVDDNDETRISRALVAYGSKAGATGEKAEDYSSVRVELDVDAEEREFYGEPRLKVVLSKWIQATDTVSAEYFTAHLIDRFRHGARLLRARLEVKDDDVGLGTYVRVKTSLVQDVHGNPLNSIMQIVKKRPLDDSRFEVEALDTRFLNAYWFYAPDSAPDWASATEADKRYGYLSDERGFVGTPAVPAPVIW